MITRRSLIAVTACLAVSPRFAFADAPILTLRRSGGLAPVLIDRAAMSALQQTSFRTTTPWNTVPKLFSGVAVADFLAAFDVTGRKLRLSALNDYAVESDIDSLVAGQALFATHQDGELLTVENKGPVFVVFPFDERPELQHQIYFSRCVWQLAEIEVTS